MDYKLTLSEEATQVVLNALTELPFKVSAEVIHQVVQQVNEQKLDAQRAVNSG